MINSKVLFRGRYQSCGFLGVGLVILLFTQPATAAICRISDFADRDLASVSELERLAFVTQMTRTEFSRFKKLEPGTPDYHPLIANSVSLHQAKQRAKTVLEKQAVQDPESYLEFWATNRLTGEQLVAYNVCDAAKTVGLFINGRLVNPGVVEMAFSHLRPVGVAGPLSISLISTENIRNSAELETYVEEEIGRKDQFRGKVFTLRIADPEKSASVTMKFGEENPRTLHIPPSPFPDVKLPRMKQEKFAGTTFRDCDICPEMVGLPGGSFIMGTPEGEGEREGVPEHARDRGVPRHKVTIGQGLAVGKYEVTVGQYRAFIEDTGYQPSDSCHVMRNVDGVEVYDDQPGYSWQHPSYPVEDNFPVTCVTWEDARAYADWLSRETGYDYRLLSEAEYEYATRAGTDTAYYWGDDPKRTEACQYSNQPDWTLADHLDNDTRGFRYRFQCDDGYPFTAPVGQYEPNAFGLYDMLGNAWEFVQDCWHDNYVDAPADGSAWMTGGDCDVRVMRGGSWGNTPWFARSSNRAQVLVNYAGHSFGFRVATKR